MKKGYIILIIVLGVLIVAGLGLFIYSAQSKAQTEKRNQNLVELPSGVDYSNLTPDQFTDLLKDVASKHHTQTIKDNKKNVHAVGQDVIFTKDGKPIESGQEPNEGDGNIDPTDPGDTDAPTLAWPEFEYFYSFAGGPDEAKIAEGNAKLGEIKDLVEKYYPEMVEIFGLPYNVENRTICFHYNKDSGLLSYFPQSDEVLLDNSNIHNVLVGLAAAFQGEYAEKIPETWKYGSREAAYMILMEKHPEDRDPFWDFFIGLPMVIYEQFNSRDYPIWGANVFYPNDVFQFGAYQRQALAAGALVKPYRYNNKFFANLNQKIYTLDKNDSSIWDQERNFFGEIKDTLPDTIEGNATVNWYEKQHPLHQVETNPLVIVVWRVFGQDFAVATDQIWVFSFKSHITENGITFVEKANRSHEIKIYNDRNELKKEETITTDESGKAASTDFDDLNFETGRYLGKVANRDKEVSCMQYAGDEDLTSGITGVVKNFGEGKIAAYQKENKIEETDIIRGFFHFQKSMPGVVTLKVYDVNNNQVLEKEIARTCTAYFTILDSPVTSYEPQQPAPSRSPAASDEITSEIDTSDWLTYDSGFTIKYPSDWVYQKQEVTNPTEKNPITWEVVFGRSAATNVVWIGHCGRTISTIKQYLTNEQYPGTEIREEKNVEVSDKDTIRLKYPSVVTDYDIYLYYIHEGMNVPLTIQGPAPDDPNNLEGEAAIFQAMLETLEIPTDVPQ